MDIEFHYYMTYLIATRAGFRPADALIIAASSEGVDDNHIPVTVNGGSQEYQNVISQTMDITRPHHDVRIYPIFHFIPGDPGAASARRKDGRTSIWNTTPDSKLANEMIDAALVSKDLYRIGASSHAFCDTWAHQNFLGIEDDFNIVPIEPGDTSITIEFLNSIAKIGHGPAKHKPDWPGLSWVDGRLIAENASVTNRARFMAATRRLFEKYYNFIHGNIDPTKLKAEQDALTSDLLHDIGDADQTNQGVEQRTSRYKLRALQSAYGAKTLPTYDQSAWSNAALIQEQGNLFDWLHNVAIQGAGDYGDLIRAGTRAKCTWRNSSQYRQTDWYKFQEAIRVHLDECWQILVKSIPGANVEAR